MKTKITSLIQWLRIAILAGLLVGATRAQAAVDPPISYTKPTIEYMATWRSAINAANIQHPAGDFLWLPALNGGINVETDHPSGVGNDKSLTYVFSPADPAAYNQVVGTILVNVVRANVSIRPTDRFVFYGQQTPAPIGSPTTPIGTPVINIDYVITQGSIDPADGFNLQLYCARVVTDPATDYTISLNLVDPLNRGANYNFQQLNSKLTVKTMPIGFTPKPFTVFYGDRLVLNNLRAGDNVTLKTDGSNGDVNPIYANYTMPFSWSSSANAYVNDLGDKLVVRVGFYSSQTGDPAVNGFINAIQPSADPLTGQARFYNSFAGTTYAYMNAGVFDIAVQDSSSTGSSQITVLDQNGANVSSRYNFSRGNRGTSQLTVLQKTLNVVAPSPNIVYGQQSSIPSLNSESDGGAGMLKLIDAGVIRNVDSGGFDDTLLVQVDYDTVGNVPGTFTVTPLPISRVTPGGGAVARPNILKNYLPQIQIGFLNIDKNTPNIVDKGKVNEVNVIPWNPSTTLTFGDLWSAANNLSAESQNSVNHKLEGGSYVAPQAPQYFIGSVQIFPGNQVKPSGSVTVKAVIPGDAYYKSVSREITFSIAKKLPGLVWQGPTSIPVGTILSLGQELKAAIQQISGLEEATSIGFSPGDGTIIKTVGTLTVQTYSIETDNYLAKSISTDLTVVQGTANIMASSQIEILPTQAPDPDTFALDGKVMIQEAPAWAGSVRAKINKKDSATILFDSGTLPVNTGDGKFLITVPNGSLGVRVKGDIFEANFTYTQGAGDTANYTGATFKQTILVGQELPILTVDKPDVQVYGNNVYKVTGKFLRRDGTTPMSSAQQGMLQVTLNGVSPAVPVSFDGAGKFSAYFQTPVVPGVGGAYQFQPSDLTVNGGPYAIVANFPGDFLFKVAKDESSKLTIARKIIVVQAPADIPLTYGQAVPSYTIIVVDTNIPPNTVSAVPPADTFVVSGQSDYTVKSPVGSYPILPVIAIQPPERQVNYEIRFGPTKYVQVAKRPVVVVIASQFIGINQPLPAVGLGKNVTVNGMVNNDDPASVFTPPIKVKQTATKTDVVGSFPIVFDGDQPMAVNYTVNWPITSATLYIDYGWIVWNPPTKGVYGFNLISTLNAKAYLLNGTTTEDKTSSLTYKINGVAATPADPAYQPTVGTYNLEVTFTQTGPMLQTLVQVIPFTIERGTLVVSVKDKEINYPTVLTAFAVPASYNVLGMASIMGTPETVETALNVPPPANYGTVNAYNGATALVGSTPPAGTYPIKVTFPSTQTINYNIQTVDGKLTVKAAEISVSENAQDITYGQKNAIDLLKSWVLPNPSATVKAFDPASGSEYTKNNQVKAGQYDVRFEVSAASYATKSVTYKVTVKKYMVYLRLDDSNTLPHNTERYSRIWGSSKGYGSDVPSSQTPILRNTLEQISTLQNFLTPGNPLDYTPANANFVMAVIDYDTAVVTGPAFVPVGTLDLMDLIRVVTHSRAIYGSTLFEFSVTGTRDIRVLDMTFKFGKSGDDNNPPWSVNWSDLNPKLTPKADRFTDVSSTIEYDVVSTSGNPMMNNLGFAIITSSSPLPDAAHPLNYTTAKYTINKSDLTVTTPNKHVAYGDGKGNMSENAFGNTISHPGVAGDVWTADGIQVTWDSPSVSATSDVGIYPLIVNLQDPKNKLGKNYTWIQKFDGDPMQSAARLYVDKRDLTVRGQSIDWVIDRVHPPLTILFGAFANGQDSTVLSPQPTISVSGIPVDGNGKPTVPMGLYTGKVVVSGGGAQNYQLVYVNGDVNIVPHRPPVANPDAVVRAPGDVLKIVKDKLVGNDYSQDGDNLTGANISKVNGVTVPTTPPPTWFALTDNGARIQTDATKLFFYYVPVSGSLSNAPDSFTYTITDSSGLQATAKVSVLVRASDVNAIPQNTISAHFNPDGSLTMTFIGITHKTYNLQASPLLINPQWQVITVTGDPAVVAPDGRTITAPASGLITITDPEAATYPNRFYRLIVLP